MGDISEYSAGDRFKIVINNPKGIPVGTIVEYTGEQKRYCGGTYRMTVTREDNSQEVCVFDHWLEKIA